MTPAEVERPFTAAGAATDDPLADDPFAAAMGLPYNRRGDRSGMFLTAKQWRDYDSWNAHCDKMQAKYGHFLQGTGMWNLMRTIR